jgi:Fic family protein
MRAVIELMIAEAMKTSEIEGEYLSRQDVASSIRNQMGIFTREEIVKDLRAKGVADLMVEVRNSWDSPLSDKVLFDWHRLLMQGSNTVASGRWRKLGEPMQVVSGSVVNPIVHFEAPPSKRVPKEMAAFINWFNKSRKLIPQGPVRSALAHLYFESIHPFEDGNGRIGRALAEKAVSQQLGRPAMISLSKVIQSNKKAYYEALETAQRSNEVTEWIQYFVGVILEAQVEARANVEFILRKAKFFDCHKHTLSERQLKVVRRMLDEGPAGFDGGMNARKYVSLTRVSKATATRDLQDLLEKGVLNSEGGGRSTRYGLNI